MVLLDLNSPPQFTTWQLALVAIALVSICILVQSVRRWKMTDSLLSLAIGATALILLYSTLMIQAYTGLNGNLLVAHVKATAIANSPTGQPALSVEVTLYDHGQATSDKTYLLLGNEWMLQGDMIKVSGLLGIVGLHSGYKLTRLEGRYDDPAQEANEKHTVIALNGGDDGFFQAANRFESILAPFLDASYGNAVIDGTGSFDVYVSQTGLWAKGV